MFFLQPIFSVFYFLWEVICLANVFISSDIAILNLFLLEFAYILHFHVRKIFGVHEDYLKLHLFNYENANKLKCVFPQNRPKP